MTAGEILILGTIVDASRKNTSGYANLIRDLRLNKNQLEINQLFQQEITDLKNQSPQEKFLHIFLTQEEYDALQSYEENVLYFIVEKDEPVSIVWGLGDSLPIILS